MSDVTVPIWLIVLLLGSAGGWGLLVSWMLISLTKISNETLEYCATLLKMHENPEKYGMGSREVEASLREVSQALTELTHYLKVSIENETGQRPLPPLRSGAKYKVEG